MNVKLISYTQPSNEMISSCINDIQDLVSFCARVSNPSNQYNTATNNKLLKYLISNKHWSVFEMANVCLEIETTRDIARQILRHRSMNFQEFSQRYSNAVDNMSFVIREARLQDTTNRQNSINTDDEKLQKEWEEKQQQVILAAKEAYEWAISNGIAKEQARVVLPEGNTMSRMYVNGTLRSWIHYCELRCGNGTQKEHMQVARECAKVISKIFPLIEKIIPE